MGLVIIGADIGQKVDPTAIVVVETSTRGGEPTGEWTMPKVAGIVDTRDIRQVRTRVETIYTARYIQRLELGTSYPKVAEHIAGVVGNLKSRGIHSPFLIVDATGVGLPVVDLLRDALKGTAVRLLPVTFTYGDKYTKTKTSASVGKAHLVSRLQALLQTDRLILPITAESQALARELKEYEIKVDVDANDKYGAFKTGAHDDLVTALGLAVLEDPIKEANSRRLVVHESKVY